MRGLVGIKEEFPRLEVVQRRIKLSVSFRQKTFKYTLCQENLHVIHS